jgi:co-chaperonin GroES (HSP10)
LIKSIDAESKLLEGIVRHIRLRPDLSPGDHVCFQHDSNWEYEVDGKVYFAMKEENVWMKLKDELCH